MYYAGIDAHVRYLRIALLDKDGNLVLEATVSSEEPEQLVETLSGFRPLSVVVETCPAWPWIQELLVAEGIEFHLAHARDLRMIAHNAQKNDAVDARLLACPCPAFPRRSARAPGLAHPPGKTGHGPRQTDAVTGSVSRVAGDVLADD
jgi:hypothetical protein